MTGLSWVGAFDGQFNQNFAFRGDLDFVVEVFAHDAAGGKPDVSNSLFGPLTVEAGLAGVNDGDVTSTPQADPTK